MAFRAVIPDPFDALTALRNVEGLPALVRS
jgi:hypothetical protein